MAMGKWIGCVLGAMNAGPLGALFGLIIGSVFDYLTEDHDEQGTPMDERGQRAYQQQGYRNSFLFSMMVMAADVIQADGRIMHSEMEYVRRFLRTNFSNEAEQEGEAILLRLFEEKKKNPAAWHAQITGICRQLAANMPEEHRVQLIAFLCEIAKADGTVATQEREALRNICQAMGLAPQTAEQLMGLGGTSLDDAYKLLGITAENTDDEVRRAYKKMAMQHHPDRVAYLGEDVRKASEKKFQEINEAKERIYKARNMK